jgi:SAM-dependent methyltransferase
VEWIVSLTTQYWIDKFGLEYERRKLSEISWVACSASSEFYRLIADGMIAPGSTIVDIGCGLGAEAIFAASQRMRVYGVDISAEALRRAKQLQEIFEVEVTWLQADANDIPLEDGHADVVNDRFFFHNVESGSRELFARSAFRILKPGGLLVLRAFSDRMSPGTGPFRLTSDDLWTTFAPGFSCEHLSLFRNLPTVKRPDQWHWYSLWRRRTTYGEKYLTGARPT